MVDAGRDRGDLLGPATVVRCGHLRPEDAWHSVGTDRPARLVGVRTRARYGARAVPRPAVPDHLADVRRRDTRSRAVVGVLGTCGFGLLVGAAVHGPRRRRLRAGGRGA